MKKISTLQPDQGINDAPVVKVTDFQVINFHDDILIYALGEDGVIREFANGKWTPFPMT